MPNFRQAACALTLAVYGAAASAQYVAPDSVFSASPYYGCGGIFLVLVRQSDDLARIRGRLRALELETDQEVRARQWIGTLEAENRNLRQQNALFQQRVIELEEILENRRR